MNDEQWENITKQIIARAKQIDAGKTSCAEAKWREIASALVFTATQLDASPDQINIDFFAQRLQTVVSELFRNSTNNEDLSIPAICPLSASSIMRDTTGAKSKYEAMTLNAEEIIFGAFVSVKSYTQFCWNMTEEYELKPETEAVIRQPIHELFPREATKPCGQPSEKPRSAMFAMLLASEFADDPKVICVHQCPIVPKGKTNEQDVDIAIVKDGAIAVCIEYKPASDFHAFCTQAAIYGTDTMNTFRRPCLVVQARGLSMETLEIRAFGVVMNPRGHRPTHALSLLLDSASASSSGTTTAYAGLKLFISGLKAYLSHFSSDTPGQWRQRYLSNVVALHTPPADGNDLEDSVVYKAYDYRLHRKEIPSQDRRSPNIDLVREFIDSEAKLTSTGNDFHIVSTKFLRMDETGKKWYGATAPKNLARIVRQMLALHERNLCHGDIRLRNMILHAGRLTDYDFCRPQGSLYPSVLANIHGDGERHPEVSEAIELQCHFNGDCRGNEAEFKRQKRGSGLRIGQLPMKFEHDIYAMKYVLQQFQPLNKQLKEEWDTIIATESWPEMIERIEGFSHQVEFTGIMHKTDDGTTPSGETTPSGGTGTPSRTN